MCESGKRALFISSRELYPVIGGDRIRTAQQLEFLSKMYNVDVVCESDRPEDDLGSLKGLIQSYWHFYVPKWKNILYTLRAALNSLPLQVNYYFDNAMAQFIEEHVTDYDLVFCNNIRTAEYVMHLPLAKRPVLVMDFVDAISMNYTRAKTKSHWPMSLIYSIDEKRVGLYEKSVLRVFDHCMAISPADALHIEKETDGNRKIGVVNNSVATDYGVNYSTFNGHVMTFVGKMNYEPNIVAVENFACNVLPGVRKVIPDATFNIVGIHPDSRVAVLGQLPGVFVTGFVEDVNQAMLNSSFVVAPMLTGAGVQNKILQAMALGCCVLTTPIGQEGIYAEEEVLVIAQDNEELIEQAIDLLQHPDRCMRVGKCGQRFVRDNMSKEVVFEEFKKVLEGNMG